MCYWTDATEVHDKSDCENGDDMNGGAGTETSWAAITLSYRKH
jgi:hypothetical protein